MGPADCSKGRGVVQVDFPNCLTPSSVAEIVPFPAALNDCVSGLRWVYANAATLNIDPTRIVINGKSGGGNLTLAVAIKLKRDGDLKLVKGLYATGPYLAGEWTGNEGSSQAQCRHFDGAAIELRRDGLRHRGVAQTQPACLASLRQRGRRRRLPADDHRGQ
jgi:acetyl esterase/lipase